MDETVKSVLPKDLVWATMRLPDKENTMIQVEITEEMKKRAWAKSREMGVIKNSIMKGDGNIAGFIEKR